MPPEGWAVITIRQELKDKLLELWMERKEEYHAKGITSFSGFCTFFLHEALEKETGLPSR